MTRAVGRFLLGLLAVVLLAGCTAPPPVEGSVNRWVAANAVPLDGVDPQAGLDDVVPLGRALGDARVVGLGESTHGVAEELALKHRLLRVLVEQHGFRSVAWEEDWTVGAQIDAYLRTGAGDLAAIMARMSPQWQSREVADVLRWLRAFNTGRGDQVRFVGVEYYLTRATAYDAVEAYVAATAPEQRGALSAELRPLRPGTDDMFAFVQQVMAAPDKLARLDRARRAAALVKRLPHRPADRGYELAVHNADQIVAFYQHYSLSDAEALVYRDRRAAENVRWWGESTGDKIAYWAATAHTANAPALRIGGPPGPDMRFPSSGSYLRSWYGPRYRSVAVTPGSGEASAGPGQMVSLTEPAVDRFEHPLLEAALPVFALDLHASAPPPVRAWLDEPARFRGLADRGPDGFLDGGSPAQWFDVVVFHEAASPAAPTA